MTQSATKQSALSTTHQPNVTVTQWLEKLSSAFHSNTPSDAAFLFEEDGYWRDLVAFTWNIKTLEGRTAIRDMINETVSHIRPTNWQLDEDVTEKDGVIDAWITFDTAVAKGRAYLRLRDGLAWTFLTTMVELTDYPEKRNKRRPKGAEHGANKNRQTWLEKRQHEEMTLGYTEQPYCLIIGGGQGGIGLAARLRQLDVPTIVIDALPKPGDTWRNRYKSLSLHDPIWYDHMPYLPFPENWPVFTPKDKIGDWLEMYTKVMEINYWGSTRCTNAQFDEEKQEWVVSVERDGVALTLRPKQLVLATGMSGIPNIPEIPGMDTFEGEQHHSSKHPGGEAYKGKKCIVLGGNNSAHDICCALWENEADVTMIQRSSTHIIKSDSLMELVLGGLYSEEAVENGMTTYKADMTFASIPFQIMPQFHIPAYQAVAEKDKDFYQRLTDAGFLLDFGEDGSGLFMKYLRRGSGYYIDVGASDLVANGDIKLKSGVSIERIKPKSVVLTDGTELEADLIVYATGFGSMNGWAAKIISQDVADKVGKCWGMGSNTAKDPGPWEGELRNMWKPTHQEALWFHGGNLHQSRHYSQYLSLQLKARMEGIETPVYGMEPVHHLS
ncbi:NAD(P)-binding domain-containing protein [Marinomonas mediterranea]|uniref:FAD-dependent pyridine nucleotide-disulfide oxidoreductase n=1 Tax=Marinomonas mediterranea (strain ATCC 700492 / JCM 21426 / NBRC 103028 / MMB-1) TaxID=717774 RepID=F2K413_MARM1|nr:NAD(P)/FAD-dependent oxidoreductase [Marinomonas mediterranea]ADZ91355.1 FAD-dependent pyridine nucleotide-disulfide oxidoreductase [Marinomonas mediterranea MMB-1]WCN13404.1 NAD(P)-binding domain-containing protein [Marinomonas mediterranea]WCN17471.1 NAD(P)-binding domain-containing protein [Marinomonas mediterranea MMB-1]